MAKVVRYTALQKMEVLQLSKVGNREICILMDCGITKAAEYRKRVVRYMRDVMGKEPENECYPPTEIVVKVLAINETRIFKEAKKALALEGMRHCIQRKAVQANG